jgi:hypothetical protein
VRSAKETCWAMGVPYMLELNLRAQIIDDDMQIVFLYEETYGPPPCPAKRGTPRQSAAELVRRFGRASGGRYAAGGYRRPQRPHLGGFGTPHTDKIHMVERYHLLDPNTLEMLFTIEDPRAPCIQFRLRKRPTFDQAV